jgi:hypothetical protein
MLMTRMRDAGWQSDIGIAQLNHPISPLEFGRDLGWPDALDLEPEQAAAAQVRRDGAEPVPAHAKGVGF